MDVAPRSLGRIIKQDLGLRASKQDNDLPLDSKIGGKIKTPIVVL